MIRKCPFVFVVVIDLIRSTDMRAYLKIICILFLNQNMCCTVRRFCSFGHPQHIFKLIDKKIPRQHTVSGHHRPSSETPFKWRFARGPMAARSRCLPYITFISHRSFTQIVVLSVFSLFMDIYVTGPLTIIQFASFRPFSI